MEMSFLYLQTHATLEQLIFYYVPSLISLVGVTETGGDDDIDTDIIVLGTTVSDEVAIGHDVMLVILPMTEKGGERREIWGVFICLFMGGGLP